MPASSAPPPGLLYIEDSPDGTPGIATRCGIKYGTYRKWRMAGKGPQTFILGGRVVARVEAVDAYIAGLEQAASQPKPQMRPAEPRINRHCTPAAA